MSTSPGPRSAASAPAPPTIASVAIVIRRVTVETQATSPAASAWACRGHKGWVSMSAIVPITAKTRHGMEYEGTSARLEVWATIHGSTWVLRVKSSVIMRNRLPKVTSSLSRGGE